MGMFDFLDPLLKGLQYPQSVMSGIMGSLNTIAPTENMKRRNPDASFTGEIGKGLRGGYTPSEASGIDKSNVAGRLESGIMDVLFDPLNAIAGVAKAGQLGRASEPIAKAFTYGPIENASGLDKALRGTRRVYEGYKGSDQDADSAVSAALLATPLENRVMPALGGKLKKLFPQTKTDDEIEETLQALTRSNDPTDVASVMNTKPLALEAGPMRPRVPQSSTGLDALTNSMQRFDATPQPPLGRLNAAPNPIPVGPVPPGNALERAPQGLDAISRLDLGDMTQSINRAGPVGELGSGPNRVFEMQGPGPTSQPYFSRDPEMMLDPEQILDMLRKRGPAGELPITTSPYSRAPLPRDRRFPPNRNRGQAASPLEEFLRSIME